MGADQARDMDKSECQIPNLFQSLPVRLLEAPATHVVFPSPDGGVPVAAHKTHAGGAVIVLVISILRRVLGQRQSPCKPCQRWQALIDHSSPPAFALYEQRAWLARTCPVHQHDLSLWTPWPTSRPTDSLGKSDSPVQSIRHELMGFIYSGCVLTGPNYHRIVSALQAP